MPRKRAEAPCRICLMPGDQHKLDCPRSGRIGALAGADKREAPPCPLCGSRETRQAQATTYGPPAMGRFECLGCKRWFRSGNPQDAGGTGHEQAPPLALRANALGATAEELQQEALYAVSAGSPLAYLQLLRSASPERWRARLLSVIAEDNGNISRAALRVGMTYRGLLKAIVADPKLQQEIAKRWPERETQHWRSC